MPNLLTAERFSITLSSIRNIQSSTSTFHTRPSTGSASTYFQRSALPAASPRAVPTTSSARPENCRSPSRVIVQTRRDALPSDQLKRSSSVPTSRPSRVVQLAAMTTWKRLTTSPERDWNMPQPSTVPLK
jgi:hypothetical protein